MSSLDLPGLDLLFLEARTHHKWRDEPVPDALLHRLYETVRWGPTTGNSQPMRLMFIRSPEAKERLKPHLSPTNVDKTMTAPVTAIVAHDLAFYEPFPMLGPVAASMRDRMASLPEAQLLHLAQQGSSMQGAYLILAARALGLDCGPMGGFNKTGVDDEFLAATTWRSNFLLNLGYGDPSGVKPRAPRLDFDQAVRLI